MFAVPVSWRGRGSLLGLVAAWVVTAGAAPPPAVGPVAPMNRVIVDRPTLVWVWGRVSVTPGDGASAGGEALVGAVLAPGEGLDVAAGGGVRLLSGGDGLVEVTGPARCAYDAGRALECRGGSLRRASLDGYREPRGGGPLDPVGALDPGASPEARPLVVVEPAPTVHRDRAPPLRWRWAGGDARFDLDLVRVDGSGDGRPVERWRGLGTRELALWRPLARGARYRLRVWRAGEGARPDKEVDEVTFGVLGPVEARAVEGSLGILDAIRRRSGRLRPELEVLKARLLESYGVLEEAARVWSALALLYPDRRELRDRARWLYHRLGR